MWISLSMVLEIVLAVLVAYLMYRFISKKYMALGLEIAFEDVHDALVEWRKTWWNKQRSGGEFKAYGAWRDAWNDQAQQHWDMVQSEFASWREKWKEVNEMDKAAQVAFDLYESSASLRALNHLDDYSREEGIQEMPEYKSFLEKQFAWHEESTQLHQQLLKFEEALGLLKQKRFHEAHMGEEADVEELTKHCRNFEEKLARLKTAI